MTDESVAIDYPAKRKTGRRLHPVIFLMGWIAIITFGWVVTMVGIFELLIFLPEMTRIAIRHSISIYTRAEIKHLLLLCVIAAVAIAQRYWLNRNFRIRLSRWFVILSFIIRTIVTIGYIVLILVSLPPEIGLASLTFYIMVAAIFEFLIGLGQWWLLRPHWRSASAWILASILAGVGIGIMLEIFVKDGRTLYLFVPDRVLIDGLAPISEWIPIGIAHGLITGLAAIALDRLTRRGELKRMSAEFEDNSQDG